MKDWIEVKISTTPEGQELAAEVLYAIGAEGLYIEDPKEFDTMNREKNVLSWDYVDNSLLEPASDTVVLHAYLPKETFDADKNKAQIEETAGAFGVPLIGCEFNAVQESDWADEWRKYYKVFRVGKRLVIKPSWEEYTPEHPTDCVLSLDPGVAFGTGTHETTLMCMEMLEDAVSPDCHALDIGCGSGILGIAALKLGAKDCLAVDLDPDAVRVARENAERNEVSEKLRVIEGNLVDVVDGSYQVILSNIVADAILSLSDTVKPFLLPEGKWIASGIIRERYDEVKEKLLASGFLIQKEMFMGEWAAVMVTAG